MECHQVVGTMGYAAPEYIQTGRLTSKSDVWSYGVFLYELITGRRPLERNRPKCEQKLLEWVKPYISDPKKFRMIVDPRLEGKYSLKSAQKLSIVANRCLARHPKTRPKMSEVLEMVNRILNPSTETRSTQPTVTHSVPTVTPKEVTHQERTSEETERKGKRSIMDLKNADRSWLSCMWSPKLVRTC